MRTWSHRVIPACIAVLAACGHGEPFGVTDHSLDVPLSTTPPVRLTYNEGDDRTPSWLPDGSGVLYSSERLDAVDHDRCLLEMPASGGTVRRTICERAVAHEDSTDRFESPAVSAGGRIVFLRAVSTIGLQRGPVLHLMLGSAADPAAAAPVLPVPYFAPNQKTHYYLAQPHWLSDDRFVYVAQNKFYQGSSFLPDTFTTGLELVRAEVAGDAVTLSVIPGTDYASSVAPGGDEDTIVFTLGGDSKVYRQSLSTGERIVIHDFGIAGITRDVQLRGSTLVAVVGRSVLFQLEDPRGWIQRDEGGDLHVVDLGTGQGFVVSRAETLFRRPTLSPDGRHIVVEASPFAPVHVGPSSEFNATNHRPDLWLFDLQ